MSNMKTPAFISRFFREETKQHSTKDMGAAEDQETYRPKYPWCEYIKGGVGGKPLDDLLNGFDSQLTNGIKQTIDGLRNVFLEKDNAPRIFQHQLYNNLVHNFSSQNYTADQVSTILSRYKLSSSYYQKEIGSMIPEPLREPSRSLILSTKETTGYRISSIAYSALVQASPDKHFMSSQDLYFMDSHDLSKVHGKTVVYRGKDGEGNCLFRYIVPSGSTRVAIK